MSRTVKKISRKTQAPKAARAKPARSKAPKPAPRAKTAELAALVTKAEKTFAAPAAPRHEPPVLAPDPKPLTGKARARIIEACSDPAGASSAELYQITGWTFASWSHQLKLIAKAHGYPTAIRKVDGVTRYFVEAEPDEAGWRGLEAT